MSGELSIHTSYYSTDFDLGAPGIIAPTARGSGGRRVR